MRAALESGVTTVRSAGVSHYVDVGLRELVKQGLHRRPDMIAAGYHVRPSIAAEIFLDFPDLGDLMERRRARRRWHAAGGSRQPVARRRLDQDARDRTRRHAGHRSAQAGLLPGRAAHHRGRGGTKNIPVMAHAHGAEGADAAVRAGVRSIEHGTYLTDETLQLMAKQGTYFDPTADIVNDLAEPGGDYDNAALKRRGEMMRPILKAAIGKRGEVRREDRGRVRYRLRSEQRRPRLARSRRARGRRADAAAGAAGGDHHQRRDAAPREADRRDRGRLRGGCAGRRRATRSTTFARCSIRCW